MVGHELEANSGVGARDYNEDHGSMWVNKGGRVHSVGGGHIGGDKGGGNEG